MINHCVQETITSEARRFTIAGGSSYLKFSGVQLTYIGRKITSQSNTALVKFSIHTADVTRNH